MRAVGVRTLKNELSHYLRLVKQGERILIADHDRVVAELIPPCATTATTVADAMLANLVRTGCVTPAAISCAGRPRPTAKVAVLPELLAELDHDRSDR